MYSSFLIPHFERAERSVAVSLRDPQHRNAVYGLLTNIAKIENAVEIINHYDITRRYLFVEFDSEETAKEVIRRCVVDPINHDRVAWYSRVLDFIPRESFFKSSKILHCDSHHIKSVPRKFKEGLSMKEQMHLHYDVSRLTSFDLDLRAFICQQLKEIVSRNVLCHFLPFGSTITGLGTPNSDLDIQIVPLVGKSKARGLLSTDSPIDLTDRKLASQFLSRLASLIEIFDFSNVTEILRARVPIVRFNSNLLGVQCDLSTASSLNKMTLSKILRFYGISYPWFPVLVCTLRVWARRFKVVLPSPSDSLTNFGFTLLILFHLIASSVVPSFDRIFKTPGVLVSHTVAVYPDLETTMMDFFNFYANFGFGNKKINLRSGTAESCVDADPLFIINPLEAGLTNVTKNVRQHRLDHFVKSCRHAHKSLKHKKCLNHLVKNDFFL